MLFPLHDLIVSVRDDLITSEQSQDVLPLPGSPWNDAATKLSRASAQFGWPMLILYLVGPRLEFDDGGSLFLLLAALPVFTSGVFLRLWARGFSRDEGFVMDGPYRYVRNPVELGALICFAGGAILMGHPTWYCILVLVIAMIFLSFVGTVKDRALAAKLGPVYLRYARRVGRWIPSHLPGSNRSNRSFSLMDGLKWERESLLWALGFILVYALRRHGSDYFSKLAANFSVNFG